MNHVDRSAAADPRARVAAANNAAWCAAMCRAHGLTTHQDDTRWWSSSRTPLYYPDAVTLDPAVGVSELLVGIDDSPGCSVKDSYATLDLTSAGFELYFAASWIHRPAAPAAASSAEGNAVVHDDHGLREWIRHWGAEGADIFVAALLDDPDVRLVCVRDGAQLIGVAVLNRAAGVVGISNLVCAPERAVEVWQSVSDIAADEFPGADLVGYEEGEDLMAATSAGFRPVGGLRVWGR